MPKLPTDKVDELTLGTIRRQDDDLPDDTLLMIDTPLGSVPVGSMTFCLARRGDDKRKALSFALPPSFAKRVFQKPS